MIKKKFLKSRFFFSCLYSINSRYSCSLFYFWKRKKKYPNLAHPPWPMSYILSPTKALRLITLIRPFKIRSTEPILFGNRRAHKISILWKFVLISAHVKCRKKEKKKIFYLSKHKNCAWKQQVEPGKRCVQWFVILW